MWAFSDESERANTLIISVVIGSPAAIRTARSEVRDLLLPGQRRIHTSDESARRRRLVLDTIGRLDAIDATALCLRRPAGLGRVDTRRLLLPSSAVDGHMRQVAGAKVLVRGLRVA